MGCTCSTTRVRPDPEWEVATELLNQQESKLVSTLEGGAIRLVNVRWLMTKSRESGFYILRYQELANVSGALLSPSEAAKLFSSHTRSVFVLSYGWLNKASPDPFGVRVSQVVGFFEQLEQEGNLPRVAGLFWDYASMPQMPRTDAEDQLFFQALGLIDKLYASALGTTVIQLKAIPPLPASEAGKVRLCALPVDMEREWAGKIVAGKYARFGKIESVEMVPELSEAVIKFESKEAAAKALKFSTKALGLRGAWLCYEYNERAYDARGWCILEAAISSEYLGRSTRHPKLAHIMGSVERAKLYEISTLPAVPAAPEAPQAAIKVAAALKAAKFTSAGDRDVVLKIYKRFQHDVAEVAAHVSIAASTDKAGGKPRSSDARRAARQAIAEEKHANRQRQIRSEREAEGKRHRVGA